MKSCRPMRQLGSENGISMQATLALAYPPEKEFLIPDQIRGRLERLSDNYLHYRLNYVDAPVSGALAKLFNQRLEKLNPEKNRRLSAPEAQA